MGALSTRSTERPVPAPSVALTPARTGVPELLRPMTPFGQFRNTFIIAADDDGLVIIVLANQDFAAEAMHEWLQAQVEASLFGVRGP